jgi:hypothetical protein
MRLCVSGASGRAPPFPAAPPSGWLRSPPPPCVWAARASFCFSSAASFCCSVKAACASFWCRLDAAPRHGQLAAPPNGARARGGCPLETKTPNPFYCETNLKQSSWNSGGALCHACVARPIPCQLAHRAQRAHRHWASSQESAAGPPPHTHTHVSTDDPADLEKGSDDGDSRAWSTEDSIEVSSHVDAILEYDLNYPHDLGQVFASDLPGIAGAPSREEICPEAVVAASI